MEGIFFLPLSAKLSFLRNDKSELHGPPGSCSSDYHCLVRVTGFEPAGGPAAPALLAAADRNAPSAREAAGSGNRYKKTEHLLFQASALWSE